MEGNHHRFPHEIAITHGQSLLLNKFESFADDVYFPFIAKNWLPWGKLTVRCGKAIVYQGVLIFQWRSTSNSSFPGQLASGNLT